MERIKISAMHLLGMIDEILTFARIEAGRESVRPEEVPLRSVVADAVVVIEPLATGKGLVVDVEHADPTLMLRTDPGKLRQILVNLLSNAVKFTDRGTISIRSRVDDDQVVIEVQDTGVGIPHEHLEHIFDSFWQVEQHATRRVGGSGLGLSVTRRLVELLGGEITVNSRVGAGSTFVVRLPRTGSAERAEAPRSGS